MSEASAASGIKLPTVRLSYRWKGFVVAFVVVCVGGVCWPIMVREEEEDVPTGRNGPRGKSISPTMADLILAWHGSWTGSRGLALPGGPPFCAKRHLDGRIHALATLPKEGNFCNLILIRSVQCSDRNTSSATGEFPAHQPNCYTRKIDIQLHSMFWLEYLLLLLQIPTSKKCVPIWDGNSSTEGLKKKGRERVSTNIQTSYHWKPSRSGQPSDSANVWRGLLGWPTHRRICKIIPFLKLTKKNWQHSCQHDVCKSDKNKILKFTML